MVKQMGIFADKLKEKSYPAAEARLAVLAAEALREGNKNLVTACALLNKKLQNDFWVLKDLFLLPVLQQVLRDMAGESGKGQPADGDQNKDADAAQSTNAAEGQLEAADKATVRVPTAAPDEGEKGHEKFAKKATIRMPASPSPAQLHALDEAKKLAAQVILFKWKNSAGEDWGAVYAYERHGYVRDGKTADALHKACVAKYGSLTNKQETMRFGELLTRKEAKQVQEDLRVAA
jgi:hypothetical protein